MIRKKNAVRATEPSRLEYRIRAMGMRMTEQRRIVTDVLENAEDHLDVEEVLRRARKKDPTIHRATVYRTLNSLKALGLVDELDLMHVGGGRHYYEIRPSKFHIHLVCTRCGTVEEPSGEFWERLADRVEKETSFKPEAMRLEIGGTCRACYGGRKS
jgi:Fur family ferric uptake transcriptional regulator